MTRRFFSVSWGMRRSFWTTLVDWKEAPHRKPLLVQGARQVGKTWILKAFGGVHFEKCVHLDFAEDPALNALFKNNLKPARILTDLSIYLGLDISLEGTLLIFDEVQLCPEALTSLKYFYEEFPAAHICASGSLLGLGLSEQNFPVGKVQREWLRPMSFSEFLEALGESPLYESLAQAAETTSAISPPIHDKAFGLVRAGLVHRVPICRTVKLPLAAYAQKNAFMLYLFDTGILGAMLHLDPATIHQYDFGQFKGFLAENAVLNQLFCAGLEPVYTWREGASEIEFLLSSGGRVIPVEVKAGLNTKAKSLRAFRERYSPETAVLLTALGANQMDDGLLHAPLYLAGETLRTL